MEQFIEQGGLFMWCKSCNIETDETVCEKCGSLTEEDIPY